MALTIIVGLYGFVGWAGAGQWLFAGLCLVAQAGANNCSAQAQRARNREGVGGSFVFMVIAMVGFSFFSAFSLEHAWARQNGGAEAFDLTHAASDPMFYLFVFLAVVEPAMYWAVEAIERAAPKHNPDADRAEAISNAPNVSTLRQTHLGATAAGAALMAFAAPQPAADALPLTHHEAPQRVRHEAPQPVRKAAPQKQTRGASKVRQDITAVLLQRGAALSPSNREIAAQFKVSPSTVDRLAKSMTPLQDAAA